MSSVSPRPILHLNAMVPSARHQRGITTLLSATILLIVITMVTLYTARSTLMEQKISANDYRLKQAMEAAQAGLDNSLAFINKAELTDLDVDGDGNLDPLPAGLTSTETLANGARYEVQNLVNLDTDGTPPSFSRIQLTVIGFSDDSSIQRTLNQIVEYQPVLLVVPDAGLAARGDINAGGSFQVNNTEKPAAIKAGGTVDKGGASTTCTASGCDKGDVSSMTAAEKAAIGIFETDPFLSGLSANEFFETFFGMTHDDATGIADLTLPGGLKGKDFASELATYKSTTGSSPSVVVVEGDLDIAANEVLGTLNDPIILIVLGEVKTTGSSSINGLLYTTGGFGAGTFNVTGAAMSENDYRGNGNLEVTYNGAVLEKSREKGGRRYRLPGTWRDF